MELILKILYFFTLALAFALMEIENEGKFGWSEKSQTWYRLGKNIPQPFRTFLGQKPLTGYHLFLFSAAILVGHMSFFQGVPWTPTNELQALAIYLAWTPLWDHLWLIFNPHYKLTEVRKAWWYARSKLVFGLIPLESSLQWAISLLFIILAVSLGLPAQKITEHLLFLSGLLFLTIFSHFTLAPLFKRWYLQMHASDDRDKSGIFH